MPASETDVKWKKVISSVSLVRTKAVWSFKDFYTGGRFNKTQREMRGKSPRSTIPGMVDTEDHARLGFRSWPHCLASRM
jgi:hypothetical protein